MWLMTPNGLKKYQSPEDILVDYSKAKLGVYKNRKKNILTELTQKMELLSTRARFIQLVISDVIVIFRRSKKQIEESMKKNGIDEKYWDDMLNIKTYQYTTEEIEKMNKTTEETKTKIDEITRTTIADMWKYDIDLVQG